MKNSKKSRENDTNLQENFTSYDIVVVFHLLLLLVVVVVAADMKVSNLMATAAIPLTTSGRMDRWRRKLSTLYNLTEETHEGKQPESFQVALGVVLFGKCLDMLLCSRVSDFVKRRSS
ncbi:hypothetical protein RUM44_009499 [Polyplax serrata]|uniref:Uncharacterized protein n=1 Tax=Polyplax serrata TaxID=468196 RepID=A0ABR1ASV6_POLSC